MYEACVAHKRDFYILRYEKQERHRKQVKARELWILIVQMQIETGTPYIIYKDQCNRKSNHQSLGTIKCAGFSPEVVAYSSSDEIAVCNTASIAVNMFVNSTEKTFDFYKLKEVAKVVTCNLDKIIDANFYPLEEARSSCYRHRAIGKFIISVCKLCTNMRFTLICNLRFDRRYWRTRFSGCIYLDEISV